MIIVGLLLFVLAGLVHLYIWALESFLWMRPSTRKTFGLRTEEEARITRPLAFNQGFYNLFLAGAVLSGVVIFAVHDTSAYFLGVGVGLLHIGAGSMVAAAVVLITSSPDKARAAAVQGTFPLLGLIAFTIGQLTS